MRLLLYALLIYVLCNALIVWSSEPTAFEETIIENDAYYPSVTICPNRFGQTNDTFETFEDIMEEIETLKGQHKGNFYISRHFKTGYVKGSIQLLFFYHVKISIGYSMT